MQPCKDKDTCQRQYGDKHMSRSGRMPRLAHSILHMSLCLLRAYTGKRPRTDSKKRGPGWWEHIVLATGNDDNDVLYTGYGAVVPRSAHCNRR